MDSKKKEKKTLNKELKSKFENKKKEVSKPKADDQQEEERNGIIPDGMNFKKFMGCGG